MIIDQIEEKDCENGKDYLTLQSMGVWRVLRYYSKRWWGTEIYKNPIEIYKLPEKNKNGI